MTAPLHRDVATGLRWSAIASVSIRIISTVRGLVLARLLGPDAFGLFFAIAAFANMVSLAAEFGLGPYLVHAGDEARHKGRAAAICAVAAGAAGAALVAGTSGIVAGPYGGSARPVAVVLAAGVLLSPLAGVYLSLLRVQLQFKRLAIIQVAAELSAITAALGLAVVGQRRDVWPLVASTLVVQLVTAVGGWAAAGRSWPDAPATLARSSREILRYGLPISLAAVTWAVALQGDNLVVGRELGVTALGFYGLAYNYGGLPSTLLGSVVGQVAFPVFSLSRARTQDLTAEFVRFTRLLALVVIPLVVAATTVADHAVLTLLGRAWLPAVTPLRVFLVGGALRGLWPTSELLRAVGRVGVELRLGVLAAPAVLAAAIIGGHQDILLVSILVAAIFAFVAAASNVIAARQIGASPVKVSAVPLPAAVIAFVAAIGTRLAVQTVTSSGLAIVSVTGGATVLAVFGSAALGLVPGWADLRAVFARAATDAITSEGIDERPDFADPGPVQP